MGLQVAAREFEFFRHEKGNPNYSRGLKDAHTRIEGLMSNFSEQRAARENAVSTGCKLNTFSRRSAFVSVTSVIVAAALIMVPIAGLVFLGIALLFGIAALVCQNLAKKAEKRAEVTHKVEMALGQQVIDELQIFMTQKAEEERNYRNDPIRKRLLGIR